MSWLDYIYWLIGSNNEELLWWQMSIRGVIAFLFGVLLVRMFGRRAFGELTPVDIIIAIMIGSNLSRALTGNAPFFPTLAATTVLMLLYWALIHAAERFNLMSRWFKGRAVWLVRDGVLDRKAMHRTGVGTRDLEESARRSGAKDLADVKEAVLERSGKISIIERNDPRDR